MERERRSQPDDRPTAHPPFDPAAYASSAEHALQTLPPMSGLRATKNDPLEVECARLLSLDAHAEATLDRDLAKLRVDMRDAIADGDVERALQVAESILARRSDDEEARECADTCRAALGVEYKRRLGSLDRIPVLLMARQDLSALELDHRCGFLLHLIDGTSTLEVIVDISGMPRFEAMRLVVDLLDRKVLGLV